MMTRVTPWWEAVRLRAEVVGASGAVDDVQMSLFNAVHGVVGRFTPYADARYYGEITHPSPNLTSLMARVAVRLGGGASYQAAPALYRLDQGMGGGKSHGLIGLWHLAAHPEPLRFTDIGAKAFAEAAKILGSPSPPDLGRPQVVVLACDNMTAGKGNPAIDGPAHSLHERFLWRLFGRDLTLFERYRDQFDKNGIAEALRAVGRPVLILVDEILDYVRQLSLTENADLAVKDMAFLRALLDTVNDVPYVAMVVVMIASENDSMTLDAEGQARRQELEDLLVRNGKPATVTSPADFAEIIRRRLFDAQAPGEVTSATSDRFASAMRGSWERRVFASLPRTSTADFAQEVERCYPFHPSLIGLAEHEWAPMTGFQKVRSTIRIFAATVWALSRRGKAGQWAPALIGPGDLPLSAAEVREAIIGSGLIADERAQANYRALASTGIVSDDDTQGTARLLDLAREGVIYAAANPRAAERAATALFLYSVVGHRGQARQGATEAELKAASFIPDASYGPGDADAVLAELQNPDTGLAALERLEGRGGQPARLFLSTRQTLTMFFRAQRAAVSEPDRDAELAAAAERLTTTGPFKDKRFVEARSELEDPRPLREILATAGVDDARLTRLVVLDPRRFSFQNGVDRETKEAIRASLGIGDDRIGVGWASSAVFAVANTQRRKVARGAAANFVAWDRVCSLDAVKGDEDLLAKAKEERANARRVMETAVRRAYQHIVYLDQDEGREGRVVRDDVRFDHEPQSALDGAVVWASLVEEGKAFGVGEFDAQALLHNLRDDDYIRPLDELRDLFWNSPRMPLLPNGDQDLQRAIFEAVQTGRLRLVGPDSAERVVSRPGEIAVGSPSLHLALPVQAPVGPAGPTTAPAAAPSPTATPSPTQPPASESSEVQVGFTLNTSLAEDARRDAVFKVLNELLEQVDGVNASHVQLVVKVVLRESEASTLIDRAREAGGSPSSTPIS